MIKHRDEIKKEYEFKYQPFNPNRGYPFEPNHFYECLECGYLVPSNPEHAIACKCRNIIVDRDAGRCVVDNPKDIKYLKLFKK